MNNPVPVRRLTDMPLTQAEIKLILRLRQLRKIDGPTPMFLVTASPLTICVLGQIELLDVPVYAQQEEAAV
jgi:hypothetical protein